MCELMQPDRLRARVLTWAEEEAKLGSFSKAAILVLEAVLFRGELPRSDIEPLIGSERSASRIANQLNKFGVLTSSSSRAPWRLALPLCISRMLDSEVGSDANKVAKQPAKIACPCSGHRRFRVAGSRANSAPLSRTTSRLLSSGLSSCAIRLR
jgi:hypothetical protein